FQFATDFSGRHCISDLWQFGKYYITQLIGSIVGNANTYWVFVVEPLMLRGVAQCGFYNGHNVSFVLVLASVKRCFGNNKWYCFATHINIHWCVFIIVLCVEIDKG